MMRWGKIVYGPLPNGQYEVVLERSLSGDRRIAICDHKDDAEDICKALDKAMEERLV